MAKSKIIIIGNGFDRAHGLKTGYDDFFNYLKESTVRFEEKGGGYSNMINEFGCKSKVHDNFYHRLDLEGKNDEYLGVSNIVGSTDCKLQVLPRKNSIYYKSLINQKEKIGYWSEIESHYYNLLVENLSKHSHIKIINDEFSHLKGLLAHYLINEVENKIDLDQSFYNRSISDLFFKHENVRGFEKIYFVSFNYTSKILGRYFRDLKEDDENNLFPIEPIHIHGKLNDIDNPIIFGYGDENSDEYKKLELELNNELLKNFKTFNYSRSKNYMKVMGLLEQFEDIHIQLIGHSSGLCDKALLRTMFQHKNVKKIESIFHQDESKYFENLYNISRIFDDNAMMREKIIPLEETKKKMIVSNQ